MNRLGIAACVFGALMFLAPLATAADPWLRSGFDPGRTGAIPFEGPQTNDTAFQVGLPGTPFRTPMIVDGAIYISTDDQGHGDLTARALWRINLSTGMTERVFNFSDTEVPLHLTPGRMILADYARDDGPTSGEPTSEILAREIPSGDELWRMQPELDRPGGELIYDVGLRSGDVLYVTLATLERVSGPPGPISLPSFQFGVIRSGVTAVDIENGEELWTWIRTIRETTREETEPVTEPAPLLDPTGGPERLSVVAGLAADGARVYPYVFLGERASDRERSQFELWGLDATDGVELWTRTDTARSEMMEEGLNRWIGGQAPAVTDTRVHIRLDAFQALNPANGETLWESPAGQTDHIDIQGTTAMAANEEAFFGTSPQSLYRLNPGTGEIEWQKTETEGSKAYYLNPMAVDEDTVYAPTIHNVCGNEGQGFEARDLDTGDLKWRWNRTPQFGTDGCSAHTPAFLAIGSGVIVSPAKDGVVTVLGQTAASLGAPELETERYPGSGEEVTLDLSDTEPGAFGSVTRYMVDWGDGTVTGWQESPVFTHTYEDDGEVTARVIAGNDANQTASTFVTFHVGEDPPPELNFLQKMFAPERQDMTFGVLGILVAVTGGAIGVTHKQRKRGRLQKELQLLEDGYGEVRDRPSECEAFLDTRKARARSLALDGELGEEQSRLVEARAEELRREMRSGALEEEFGFLPYTLVTKAREMLEDGRVTSLEAEAFFTALKEVEGLSNKQRALVRERVEAWFARDTGGKSR